MEKLSPMERIMVEDHLYMIRPIILGNIHLNESVQGLGYEDLYQTACEALCHAALTYHPDRGASFATFASVVIRNSLYSHCRKVNHLQQALEYLDAPLHDNPTLTYADTLQSEPKHQDSYSDDEILKILKATEAHYDGCSKKGIHALRLKCMGKSNPDIAAYYGVKSNLVAAWISKAAKKLKSDRQICQLLQS